MTGKARGKKEEEDERRSCNVVETEFLANYTVFVSLAHKQYSGGSNLQDHACHPVVCGHNFFDSVINCWCYDKSHAMFPSNVTITQTGRPL